MKETVLNPSRPRTGARWERNGAKLSTFFATLMSGRMRVWKLYRPMFSRKTISPPIGGNP